MHVVKQGGDAVDLDSEDDVAGHRKNKHRLNDDDDDDENQRVVEDDDEYDSEEEEDYIDRPKKKKKRSAVSDFLLDEAGWHSVHAVNNKGWLMLGWCISTSVPTASVPTLCSQLIPYSGLRLGLLLLLWTLYWLKLC